MVDQAVSSRQQRVKLLLGAGAVLIVAAVLAILFVGGSSSENAAPQGDPAPIVQLAYLDGQTAELSDLTGKPVILNFFADWCPACIAEMPDFEAAHQMFGEDVVFIGLDRSGSDAGAFGLIESTGITYDVAVDRDGSIFQAFGGLAMPTTVFIGADGSVVDQHNGVIFGQDLIDRINSVFFSA